MNFQCKFLQFYSHLTSTQLGASLDWQEINMKLMQRKKMSHGLSVTTTYSHSRSPKNIFYCIFSEPFHPWWKISESHTLLHQSQMPSSLWWHPMISDDILWFLIHLCSWKLHCPLPYMTTEYICILSWHLHWQHLKCIWWYDTWGTCLISFILSISVAPASPDEAISTDGSSAAGLIAPGVVREPKCYMLHISQYKLYTTYLVKHFKTCRLKTT